MIDQSMATIDDLRHWAGKIMERKPDFVIGEDYLRRWWVIPRNPFCNIYLHHIIKSDDDRALHDHPWDNTSVLLSGSYIEHRPGGERLFQVAGSVVTRSADQLHRLEIPEGRSAISLFMTGPKIREWGFACPQGWVHWENFTLPGDSSKTGRGCGEHD